MPGVHVVPFLADAAADELCHQVQDGRQPDDIAGVSAHWGELGLPVPADQVGFAHHLIDGGIDLVSWWRAYCRGGAGF
jgi:poly-gamma-glutamate capsule biosynthesis protein CapA/YwtB (metallophosphatase superfamily)